MIERLEELMRWTRVPLATGGTIVTAPGTVGASLRIHPHQRPLRSLHAMASQLQGAVPIGPIQRITTAAGEQAAMITLRLELDGVRHTRTIGMVIGDDEYTLVEGMARDPEIASVVERLLRVGVQPAAWERVRMVPYRVPAGWLGVRRPFATCWFGPRYPRDRARIVVCDAIPLAGDAATTQDLFWPLDRPSDDARATTEAISRAPLHGTLVCWEVAGATWALADLADSRFGYRVQLHDGNAEALTVLRAIADSFEPVRVPANPIAQLAAEAFAWLD